MRNPRLWQLALACYWVALFIGTHIPIDRVPLHRGAADKYAHVIAFTVLAIIFAITWQLSAGRLYTRHLVWAWLVIVLYGAFEEVTQPIVGRYASIFDWLADASGAALGLAVFYWWPGRWLGKANSPSEARVDPVRPRNWHRFSLKALFALMTFSAVACYWIMLPTLNAQQFVVALQSQDYDTAESLFTFGTGTFPGSFNDYDHFLANATIAPLTWNDFWSGERRISVAINYGDEGGLIGCGADISACRSGLELGLIVP